MRLLIALFFSLEGESSCTVVKVGVPSVNLLVLGTKYLILNKIKNPVECHQDIVQGRKVLKKEAHV